MGLRAKMATALPSMIAAAGDDAIYTPEEGDPIACHVFIDFNVQLEPTGIQTQAYGQGIVIEALLSEVITEPNRGETFTVDGVDYTVQVPIDNDGLTVRMVVTRVLD